MTDTTSQSVEYSWMAKGREAVEKGDVDTALQWYEKVHDPDAADESEARNMLIEANALLSKKHLMEALDHFEEALVMGTTVQRRQALEGIGKIGNVKSNLGELTAHLEKGLRSLGAPIESLGLATLVGENLVLITGEAAAKLTPKLSRGAKILRLPQHLLDQELPFEAEKCIPYSDENDVIYILAVAEELKLAPELPQKTP